MPLLPLREMSMTAISGVSVPTNSKAVGPSSASPQMTMSASWLMSLPSPARRMGWSSTNKTFVLGLRLTAGAGVLASAGSASLDLSGLGSVFIDIRIKGATHYGASMLARLDFERAADFLGAVSHDAQTKPGAPRALRRKADPVINDAEQGLLPGGTQEDAHAVGEGRAPRH